MTASRSRLRNSILYSLVQRNKCRLLRAMDIQFSNPELGVDCSTYDVKSEMRCCCYPAGIRVHSLISAWVTRRKSRIRQSSYEELISIFTKRLMLPPFGADNLRSERIRTSKIFKAENKSTPKSFSSFWFWSRAYEIVKAKDLQITPQHVIHTKSSSIGGVQVFESAGWIGQINEPAGCGHEEFW